MNSSDRFRRLETLFHELEGLGIEAREHRLAEIGAEDAALAAELARMLEPSPSLARDEQALDRMASDGGLAASLAHDGDPAAIGPYRLTRKLGQGGMGRVYLAEQSEPVQRQVALKLTRRGFDSAEAKARFRAERQALAVLEHPHIARVFDAGSTEDGRPWFAMEYIEGVTITQWVIERGLGLSDRIRLLLPVCDAIQHAHRKGLIHRDLKPSNILVVDDGGRGFPKVIDFGVARIVDLELDERSQITRFGELVGTPEYMSPEQAALGSIDIDTRSDVYSLGLVLYELLVGQLPVTGKALRALGFEAMCREIREGDTPKPSRYRGETVNDASTGRWRARLKGDLDSVLLKALAKDRERRYGSAAELADDLKRYLDDQPVLAQAPSWSYRTGKFVRRHRWPVAAAAIAGSALIAAALISSFGLIKARQAEQQALLSAQQAQQARLEAEQNLDRSEFFLGRANLYNLAQNAYSDVLQRMFGNQADVERQTRILLQRVSEAQARREQEPEAAALLSYAVGRHFLFRNDYPTAVQVLEPWLQQAYGPDDLVFLGRMLLPVLYINLGRSEESIPILRENIAKFAASWEAYTPDHVAAATQLASITADKDDLQQAEEVLSQAMLTDHGPQVNMYFANQLALMRRYQGDLEGAYMALRQVVDIINANSLLDISGTDTGRLNLAAFELYHANNLAVAEQLVQTVLNDTTDSKGRSRESGRALQLLGIIRARQGDHEQAMSLLQQAATELQRFGGRSRALIFGLAALAEVQVDAGLPEAAAATLARAEQAMPSDDARGEAAARLALARAWWLRARHGARAATEYLLEQNIHPELFSSDPALSHRQALLGTRIATSN